MFLFKTSKKYEKYRPFLLVKDDIQILQNIFLESREIS